jgi:trk system potassium uptake protein TrkA
MHVVIGGFGRVGRSLAHLLETEGHTVAVIDHNRAVFDEGDFDLKGLKLTGEAFDRETLVKAGIERAGAFAAVTSGDNSNIVSARIARERFNVPTVVARIFDPRRAAIYARLGIATITSVRWSSSQLLAMILEPGMRMDAVYGGGEVLTVHLDAPTRLTGRRVVDVDLPGRILVTSIVRDGVASVPHGRDVLSKGDRVYLTVTRDALGELKELFELEQE